MDKIESLTNTISNITLYDIKSMYNQAKNVVLNVTEMEAKVREATNDDPWGASSTLMQEIAQGTFHFQYFNEIMPSIYSRFMEKEARQWRQIYKGLQLLEYLIRHGSERVVDDARSHISTLKMLRNFHYIDEKGKDEGLNVRNRSRELVELLADVEKIRTERRKAKSNKSKFIGVGNDGMSFDSGGRYGGFGNDSLGGGSTYGSYGNNDLYASGGSSSRGGGGFSDSRRAYEEYNAGDDEVVSHSPDPAPVRSNSARAPARKATAPPPPQPVADLLGGLDDDFSTPAPAPGPAPVGFNKALPVVSNSNVSIDEDDFAEFQAAPVQAAAAPAAVQAPATKKPNAMDMIYASPVQAPVNPVFMQQSPYGMGMGMGPAQGMPMATGLGMGMSGHRTAPSLSQPSQFSSPLVPQQSPKPQPQNFYGGAMPPMSPTSSFQPMQATSSRKPATGAPAPAKSANFDDLWSLSLGGPAKPASNSNAGKSIKDLEKEKAMAGLWGTQQKPPSFGASVGASNASFGGAFGNAAPPSSSSGGADDLLL